MQSPYQWDPAELIGTTWNESPGIGRREQAGIISALGAELVGLARDALARWWAEGRGRLPSGAC